MGLKGFLFSSGQNGGADEKYVTRRKTLVGNRGDGIYWEIRNNGDQDILG